MDSLTRQEVRAVDRAAIEVLGIPGLILMENAGRNCAEAIEQFLGDKPGARVAIIAGPGNNGGDGYVIARRLAMLGFKTVTYVICPVEKIAGDAKINLHAITSLQHDIRFPNPDELDDLGRQLADFDLLVDAIGGTGVCGALRGAALTAVEQINAAGKPIVAVDIPTGLDCDSGAADGPAIKADLTVTFVASKRGFDSENAANYTGRVLIADIGIPADIVCWISAESDK